MMRYEKTDKNRWAIIFTMMLAMVMSVLIAPLSYAAQLMMPLSQQHSERFGDGHSDSMQMQNCLKTHHNPHTVDHIHSHDSTIDQQHRSEPCHAHLLTHQQDLNKAQAPLHCQDCDEWHCQWHALYLMEALPQTLAFDAEFFSAEMNQHHVFASIMAFIQPPTKPPKT